MFHLLAKNRHGSFGAPERRRVEDVGVGPPAPYSIYDEGEKTHNIDCRPVQNTIAGVQKGGVQLRGIEMSRDYVVGWFGGI